MFFHFDLLKWVWKWSKWWFCVIYLFILNMKFEYAGQKEKKTLDKNEIEKFHTLNAPVIFGLQMKWEPFSDINGRHRRQVTTGRRRTKVERKEKKTQNEREEKWKHSFYHLFVFNRFGACLVYWHHVANDRQTLNQYSKCWKWKR